MDQIATPLYGIALAAVLFALYGVVGRAKACAGCPLRPGCQTVFHQETGRNPGSPTRDGAPDS